MRKSAILFAFLFAFTLSVSAQKARNDIKANITLAGSNYLAYPGPQKQLTAAPAGYEPFYISHYGRHGSRYVIGKDSYDKPYATLVKADSLGKLTPRGKEVLSVVRKLRKQGRSREGELTLLGAQQHREIAQRMYERFPQVFNGKTFIDAKSTVVIRCILSMENALHQLLRKNPNLEIRHDASHHDMYYMNDPRSPYDKMRRDKLSQDSLKAFNARHNNCDHVMSVLFNDADYVKSIDSKDFTSQLFKLTKNIQSTDLRHKLSLWDIFSDDEIYNFWQMDNAGWYVYAGPNKLSEGAGMYTQLNLLKNIIATADTCIRLPHPGATLRYGHESDVLPLVCLMNLNGFGNPVDDLELLDDKGWNNYDIFPMACNVQLIFYKNKRHTTSEQMKKGDILVKILLNEDEAQLPIKTDKAPYYRWSDVRAYMKQRIASAPAIKQQDNK